MQGTPYFLLSGINKEPLPKKKQEGTSGRPRLSISGFSTELQGFVGNTQVKPYPLGRALL